jgi:hypothetical protein
MKKLFILFSLIFSSFTYAELQDAASLVQIYQGQWRVQCLDQTVMQVSTFDILNNRVCGFNSPNPQACFNATVLGLNSFEYDSLNEIQEINSACAQGDFTTAECVQTGKRYLNIFEYDQRRESLEIVRACTLGLRRGNTNPVLANCIQVATSPLNSFEVDQRFEIIEVIRACVLGNSRTPACIIDTINRLPTFDYDQRSEMINIIRSCS